MRRFQEDRLAVLLEKVAILHVLGAHLGHLTDVAPVILIEVVQGGQRVRLAYHLGPRKADGEIYRLRRGLWEGDPDPVLRLMGTSTSARRMPPFAMP